MILYCYISHNARILDDLAIVSGAMARLNYPYYKVFYGGLDIQDRVELDIYQKSKIAHLDCDDTYEGLPSKIHSMCKFINNDPSILSNFTHIYKIDATTRLKHLIPSIPKNYYGFVYWESEVPDHRRTFHQGKCSEDSKWKNKKYEGEFVPYCTGGYGYALSLKSISIISENKDDPEKDVYEDLYVAQKLLKNDIKPYRFDNREFVDNENG